MEDIAFFPELYITNTLSGKKELFVPIDPEVVTMYVCGITPYDYAHIGHGRVYVTFDACSKCCWW